MRNRQRRKREPWRSWRRCKSARPSKQTWPKTGKLTLEISRIQEKYDNSRTGKYCLISCLGEAIISWRTRSFPQNILKEYDLSTIYHIHRLKSLGHITLLINKYKKLIKCSPPSHSRVIEMARGSSFRRGINALTKSETYLSILRKKSPNKSRKI